MSLSLSPIAFIKTPYKEKFAIPRQPGLVEAEGVIEFVNEFNDPNLIRGIEQFSHLWLIFQFHQTAEQGWSPLVRPPRLGGNKKVGVLATRSTFRPNNLGMSVVEFVDCHFEKGQLRMRVKGMDLLDNTPIIDIKPYVPYSDSLDQAKGGFAGQAPAAEMLTEFSPRALSQLATAQKKLPAFKNFIEQVLAQDPRPAYQKNNTSERIYGMQLHDYNIRWQVINNTNKVLDLEQVDSSEPK